MLVNNSLSEVYKIEEQDWKVINLRVGKVLSLKNLEYVVRRTIPSYPDLLKASQLWSVSTFKRLKSDATEVSNYAKKAISNFTSLHQEIQKIEGTLVPSNLQDKTRKLLVTLNTDTSNLSRKVEGTFSDTKEFIVYNQIADREMAIYSEKLGIYWESLGNTSLAVNQSTAKVMGAWSALENDLDIVNNKEVTITMPFIMSLDIEASIVLWSQIIKDTQSFSKNVKKMEEYWYFTG